MPWHMIGEVSLDLSTLIYFIWFIPQLKLTFKRKSTEGLSLWMHGLLISGYLADLVYGFGREMPLQYRMVTVSGLFYLGFEHFQFWRYGLKTLIDRITFYCFNFVFSFFLIYAILTITIDKESKFFYDMAGMISNFCWLTFFIPQIIKNFKEKSTKGLSFSFVILSLFTTLLDMISTFALNYDWPSKVGIPITLLKKLILVSQFVYYNKYKFRRKNLCHLNKMLIG